MLKEFINSEQAILVPTSKALQPELWAVDIFSGAGGLSIGAEMAGIKVKFAVEKDPHAAETFAFNHPGTKVIEEDICDVNPNDHIDDEDVFVVFGGPPCQGFSTSNTKTRNSDNANNKLFNEFLRFVEQLNPRWFVFENVEGITSYEKGNTVKTIKGLFEELGYSTTEKVLVASDYGVPQDRNRFIMVGNRVGIDFEFPEKRTKKVTVGEAIADLPKLANGDQFNKLPYTLELSDSSDYSKIMRGKQDFATQNFVSRNQSYVLDRYKYIGQGQNWKAIPNHLMENYSNKNNCHSGIYKRLHAEKPSVVISNYRKNMLIHPFQDRGLSVREAARLQSFPDSFTFKGSLSHIQQQIGNAVPPLLAKAIFDKILQY
ncbi:DNA cytosine methyltransferase [Sphingobacterium griseoflavum]|uniref:DNA (cytosine-5-)-methyltransferase n=1 Tax=Sphingobacterium griseoflavum TaxID=1474952 RepID=A0ABQ3I4E6_9SPHI|nr:DNA cytosine methyltransferase [Sphingobacterium griseoflavum]GHE49573.1 cytosine-specific methyltransferase [Sphingobacterium griseoflavum]